MTADHNPSDLIAHRCLCGYVLQVASMGRCPECGRSVTVSSAPPLACYTDVQGGVMREVTLYKEKIVVRGKSQLANAYLDSVSLHKLNPEPDIRSTWSPWRGGLVLASAGVVAIGSIYWLEKRYGPVGTVAWCIAAAFPLVGLFMMMGGRRPCRVARFYSVEQSGVVLLELVGSAAREGFDNFVEAARNAIVEISPSKVSDSSTLPADVAVADETQAIARYTVRSFFRRTNVALYRTKLLVEQDNFLFACKVCAIPLCELAPEPCFVRVCRPAQKAGVVVLATALAGGALMLSGTFGPDVGRPFVWATEFTAAAGIAMIGIGFRRTETVRFTPANDCSIRVLQLARPGRDTRRFDRFVAKLSTAIVVDHRSRGADNSASHSCDHQEPSFEIMPFIEEYRSKPTTRAPTPSNCYRERRLGFRREISIREDSIRISSSSTTGESYFRSVPLCQIDPDANYRKQIPGWSRCGVAILMLGGIAMLPFVLDHATGTRASLLSCEIDGAAIGVGLLWIVCGLFAQFEVAQFGGSTSGRRILEIGRAGPDAARFDDFVQKIKIAIAQQRREYACAQANPTDKPVSLSAPILTDSAN